MPRPVKSLEPVVIEAARSISSNSLSLTSPPSSSTESAWGVPIHQSPHHSINQLTAWGLQWDSIDEQVYDKDEINLSMSVRRPRARQDTPEPEQTINQSIDQSINQSNVGFMDASMKEDGFIPLNEPINQSLNQAHGREARANESTTPPFTTITTVNQPPNQSTNRSPSEFVCPCCGIGTPGGIAYHEHVTQCYISRFMESVKSPNQPINRPITPPVNQSLNSPTNDSNENSIHTLRSAVSNLDLHERIGLMEAFFRLSRTANQSTNQSTKQSTNHTSAGQDNQPMNPSVGDEAVISLLFSPTDDAKVEKVDPVNQSTNQSINQSKAPSTHDMTYRSRAPSPPVTTSYNPHHPSLYQPRTPARSPSASPSFIGSINGSINTSIDHRNCVTPAMSPSIMNQHTCLTPALHRWELDGKEDEYLHGFSLIEHDPSLITSFDTSHNPLTPPSAFKRARALSQPHVAYVDHSHNQSINQSPHMTGYSPVRVHVQPPTTHQSIHQSINPSWNLVDQNPSVNSLSARRHSSGLMSNPSTNPSLNPSLKYSHGMSAVDGLTFNAGVVNSPPSTQSSPIHQSMNHSINQHRLHQYLPVQQSTKHRRPKQITSVRQSA